MVDLVNDRESIDFKLLATLAAKHDMMMLILDDPDEFNFRSRLGLRPYRRHGDGPADGDFGPQGG